MQLGILESFLIIICFTLVTTLFCRLIKLPVIVGYLIAGSIIGPHALAWVSSTTPIQDLAEFGVALLMFTIGLEFSFKKIMTLKRSVFLVGFFQVLLTIVITIGIGYLIHIELTPLIIIGSIIAMSSTAIVLKQLTDQLELNTDHGLHAVGILLFQDLAVILLLVLIGTLSAKSPHHFVSIISNTFTKGIIAIIVMFIFGRWCLRPIFHVIAKTQQQELFTLTVLLVAVSASWATHQLGLSYALGAFIAGIMLAESEFKHQIIVEIRPFRDVLLGLFFISIGMLVNVRIWPETWPWITLMVIALMIGKNILIFVLSVLTKFNTKTSFQTSIILSQGGEFGFAILSIALTNHLLPNAWEQSILAGLLICFVISPIMIRYNEKISNILFKHPTLKSNNQQYSNDMPLTDHVVLCGFGRVGKTLADFLHQLKQPYIAIDINPTKIKSPHPDNNQVIFGDATHPEILKLSNITKAKAIIISFEGLLSTKIALQQIRAQSQTVPIIVRSQSETERESLKHMGATVIITAMFEESLAFADYLLHTLLIPEEEITQLIENSRRSHYDTLKQYPE